MKIHSQKFGSWKNIPPVLYHATFGPLLPYIYQYGLGNKKYMKYINFPGNEEGVYLAKDKNMAISFVEATESDNIPEDWLSDIVVLSIDTSKLDINNLFKDPHYNAEEIEESDLDDASKIDSFLYKGIITSYAITGELKN